LLQKRAFGGQIFGSRKLSEACAPVGDASKHVGSHRTTTRVCSAVQCHRGWTWSCWKRGSNIAAPVRLHLHPLTELGRATSHPSTGLRMNMQPPTVVSLIVLIFLRSDLRSGALTEPSSLIDRLFPRGGFLWAQALMLNKWMPRRVRMARQHLFDG
jgi:hypothetical protein